MNYGFYGRLTKDFPSQVIIDVTEVCNLACIHCPHPAFKQSIHYDARYLSEDLNKKAVDEVAEHGAQYIRYCAAGEPLINPECYNFLDYAVKHSKTFVTLTTNGTILNEKRIAKLLASGLHMLDVSIDAFKPDTYSKIRVGGDLETVRSNVLKMIDMASGTKTKIVVSFVEQPQNSEEVEPFRQFWSKRASQVVIRRLHSAAGSLPGGLQKDRRACLYPWERVILSPSGWLKFCPQEWFGGAKIADYRITTIKETWQSMFYQDLRDKHLNNKCDGVCKKCPDWAQTRWPGTGDSYADLVAAMA